ncbi:hypothetical protein G647_07468 [Cladophialophora carrionii CBS 160.54]|uniref:Uncharacterized protein n=1 Tax=Cladophialophora carrionii CBS 160.54 TaxID=1279043 RepID=V9D2G8_9EURO|nr:uncharacterized protein G647_07468 [Cladophialophora carrionii CBS 160.54]ETI21124.1 hypothetical protein G647_07468 [Cladophialophora carrionii CBS 160.54]
MPPSETSSADGSEGTSKRSDSELSSLVFEAQRDFDSEAYFKQRLEEGQQKEVADDQAQRWKVDDERKLQRQVWLDGLDEEQWDNLTRIHLPYHHTGEVNVDDMKAERETTGLLYVRGFYWPTESNGNQEIPSAFTPLRDLKRFPLPRIEYQDCAPEYSDRKRGQQVLMRYDSHKKFELQDPVTGKVQAVRAFGSDPWNSYKDFTKEELQSLKCAHHINFFGRAVPHQSGTRPATTIAILKSNPKNLNVTTPDGLWKSTIMECATQMLDPILYYGKPEILDTLRGTDLEDACIGQAEIIYTSLGWWLQDTYPVGQCPVDSDALDPFTWPEGSIVMNGVTDGFASRLEIITSSTEEKKSDDMARKTAFQGRVAKGRVKSRLGMCCWTQKDITQELAYVPRPRTGLLTPSFPSSKCSTNVADSVTEYTPHSTTSIADFASTSDPSAVVAIPPDRPALVSVRPGRYVAAIVETHQEFSERVRAFDVANDLRPLKNWADEHEDDDAEDGEETTETELWRQRMRTQELQDGLGRVSRDWADEFEPEHSTAPATQQPSPKDAVFQLADTQAVVAEVPISDFDRRLRESDAITGFQPVSRNWADEVDGDGTLASLTPSRVETPVEVVPTMVVMSHMPSTIATPLVNVETPVEAELGSNVERDAEADLLAMAQSCAGGQPAADEAQGSVKVSLPLGVVEDADSNGHRRVSASSADSTTNTSSPPTSPELEADDDINSIYDNAGTGGLYQPSLPKAAEPSDSGYIDAMDLDEEYQLQHGEPLVLPPAAPSLPYPPAGLEAPYLDVVRIPGLELINEDDKTSSPPATATLEPQTSAMVAWASRQHLDRLIARNLQVVVSTIPAMIPNMVLPGLHNFGNGAWTMTLPGQRIGLVRSPFISFEVRDCIPNRVIEEVVGYEEEVDGTLINDNVTSSCDSHIDTVALHNTAECTTEDGSDTRSSEVSPLTPPTSAGSSTSDRRRGRRVRFALPMSRKPSLATTASTSSSMATLYEMGAQFPPSVFDQWPSFDNDLYPEIPERTSSLAFRREHIVLGSCSLSMTSGKRGTFANSEHDAGVLAPRPVLPSFRRTRCDWQHASWNSVARRLTKRPPATVTTTNVATTLRSRDGIMTRANHNESQFFEFPESRRVSGETVGPGMGQKTKGFFKKGMEKLKTMLRKKK